MAGSHEVRGSIPLGSTTDPRGARRRRRAPLFCFPGRKRRPAGRDCSWALRPAGLPSPAHGHREAGALAPARPAREEAAPDPFGRIEAIRSRAGTHSALGRLGPAELEGAEAAQGRQPPEGGAKAVDGIGADSDSAAGSRTPASAACRRRSTSGGPSPAGAARAATPPSSPPTGPRRRGPSIGGRPPASAGSAASPTHAPGGA